MSQNEIAATARAEQSGRLSPWWRKLLLTVHVIVSVGVLGADIAVVTLGVTALVSAAPELIRASYLTMEVLVGSVLLPLALAALFSGILLALGTTWGLTRYYWVLTKLVLTISALTALIFLLRPSIHRAAAEALQLPLDQLATSGIGAVGVAVAVGPVAAMTVLIITTILAVYKPWGQIRALSLQKREASTARS